MCMCTCLQQGGRSRTKRAGLISAAFIPVSFPHPSPLAVFHFSLSPSSLFHRVRGQCGDKGSETGSCMLDYLSIRSSDQPTPSLLPGPACKMSSSGNRLQRCSDLAFGRTSPRHARARTQTSAVSASFTLCSDGFNPNEWPRARLNNLGMRSGSLVNEGHRLSPRYPP